MSLTESITTINTLDRLVEMLDACTSYGQFVSVVKKIQLNTTDFEHLYTWREDRYTRNCVARNEAYELVLLCWEPGQDTPIHCHNAQDCWVYMIEGEIEESQYQLDRNDIPVYKKSEVLEEGKFGFINDEIAVHKLSNRQFVRTVSLHLYASPINECKIYEEGVGYVETKKLVYDSVHNG